MAGGGTENTAAVAENTAAVADNTAVEAETEQAGNAVAETVATEAEAEAKGTTGSEPATVSEPRQELQETVVPSSNSQLTVSEQLVWGSETKSPEKLHRQIERRGWSVEEINQTVDQPYTRRESVNKRNGNSCTVYYKANGAYITVDDVTKEIVQVSDNNDPSSWEPDSEIINPFRPEK